AVTHAWVTVSSWFRTNPVLIEPLRGFKQNIDTSEWMKVLQAEAPLGLDNCNRRRRGGFRIGRMI
ncbi:MAG: hypothetical protein WD182_01980, partial [Bacteroidota bacterium]